jgi:hypothetical protein
MRDVIGIHAGDQRATGVRQSCAQRGHDAGTRPVDDADARIARRPAAQPRTGVVAGPVVDGDDLEITERLRRQLRDRVIDPRRGVAAGQEHRDAGRNAHRSARLRARGGHAGARRRTQRSDGRSAAATVVRSAGACVSRGAP